jgi:hypothetical protein
MRAQVETRLAADYGDSLDRWLPLLGFDAR